MGKRSAADWAEISEMLQMHDITADQIPRLFLECLIDRAMWETNTRYALARIGNLQRQVSFITED